jgi:hypothetical protein
MKTGSISSRSASSAQRQGEHVGHPAREVDLVGGELARALAREHEPRRSLRVDGDSQRGAVLEARRHQSRGAPLGDVGKCGLDHRVAPEPDRRDHLAAVQQRGHLGAQRLGGALDRHAARRALVLGGRDHREEAGQLLDRPVARRPGRGRRRMYLG